MSINTPSLQNPNDNENQDRINEAEEDPAKLLDIIKTIDGVEKVLRLTTITQTEQAKKFKTLTHLETTKFGFKNNKKTYIRPTQNPYSDEKVFWMVKDSLKSKLKLDDPKFVIALPNEYILAI